MIAGMGNLFKDGGIMFTKELTVSTGSRENF